MVMGVKRKILGFKDGRIEWSRARVNPDQEMEVCGRLAFGQGNSVFAGI